MMIKKLLNESLLSVYKNEKLNEGSKDHPDAIATCVSPQQFA